MGGAANRIPLPDRAGARALASLSSLLSAGAKSHVGAASGRVDSFTNRNVKRRSQGGRGEEQEPAHTAHRARRRLKTPSLAPSDRSACTAASWRRQEQVEGAPLLTVLSPAHVRPPVERGGGQAVTRMISFGSDPWPGLTVHHCGLKHAHVRLQGSEAGGRSCHQPPPSLFLSPPHA